MQSYERPYGIEAQTVIARVREGAMSYPDPKLVADDKKRGIPMLDPHVSMGSPLQVDPETQEVSLAKSRASRTEGTTSAPDSMRFNPPTK